MKKHLFTLALSGLLISSSALSQETSNLEIFSENGMPFTVTVNGVKQNETAASNVKVKNLKGEFHMVSVQFADASLGSASQNLALEPGTEQRAIIMLNKRGSYVIRPFGEPTELSSPAVTNETERRPAVYTDEPQTKTGEFTPAAPADVASNHAIRVTNSTSPSEEMINVNIGIGGNGIRINSEIKDGSSVHTSYVTETSVDMDTSFDTNDGTVNENVRTQPAPAREKATPTCRPMDNATFASAKRSIGSKSFSEEKHTTANQVLKSNCMSTDQIIEVMGLFSFEADKVTFAKNAYDRCSDAQNYWKINDAFTFSGSIEELDEFLQTK